MAVRPYPAPALAEMAARRVNVDARATPVKIIPTKNHSIERLVNSAVPRKSPIANRSNEARIIRTEE